MPCEKCAIKHDGEYRGECDDPNCECVWLYNHDLNNPEVVMVAQ